MLRLFCSIAFRAGWAVATVAASALPAAADPPLASLAPPAADAAQPEPVPAAAVDEAAAAQRALAERVAAERLASQVTIYRDAYGVAHVDGTTDEAALFGFAYSQAEDYFWQIEDNYILALGRYAEVHGSRGLNSDLLN